MTAPENPVSTWSEYYKATLNKPLNPYYELLEPHLPPIGRVLELGCGVGIGVLWFLEKGFSVEAVDVQPEAMQILESRVPDAVRERLKATLADLNDFEFQHEAYDIVVAGFCLFFLKQVSFHQVWERIVRAIAPEGLFVGQFLGPNDDWAADMTVHTSEEALRLFDGFDILHYEEAERDGHTAQGIAKHWHVHHVIARKR